MRTIHRVGWALFMAAFAAAPAFALGAPAGKQDEGVILETKDNLGALTPRLSIQKGVAAPAEMRVQNARLRLQGSAAYLNVSSAVAAGMTAGDLKYDAGSLQYYDGSVWQVVGTAGGATAFSAITTGTNTTAQMTVGNGAWLAPSGTGYVQANRFVASGSSTDAVDLGTAEIAGILGVTNGGTGANLSATGGSGQYVKQTSLGGVFTVGTIPAADIPDLSATYVTLTTAQSISGTKTFSTAPAFTDAGGPFTVSSTTVVANLNADLLDGLTSANFNQGISQSTGITVSGAMPTQTVSFDTTWGNGQYVTLATAQTITGQKTFSAAGTNDTLTFWPATAGGASYLGTLTNADLSANRTWNLPDADGTLALTSQLTGGTVTSVALSMPGQFTVGGSPVTTSGTLTATWSSQAANTVLAAPDGAAGTPSFRALVAADIPNLDASKITTGTLADARLSSNVTLLNGAQTFTGQKTFSAGGTNDTLTFWPATVGAATFAGTLTNADLSADRTWTLPDAGGTLLVGSGAGAYVSSVTGTNGITPTSASTGAVTLGLSATFGDSTSYVQNQNAGAQAADFRITGTGRLGGSLTVDNGTIASGAATTMNLQSPVNVIANIDNDNNSTANFFAVRTDGNAVNVFQVSEAGNVTILGTDFQNTDGTGTLRLRSNAGVNVDIDVDADSVETFEVRSNITTLFRVTEAGNITVGNWQGNAISATYGGTGQNSSGWTGVPSVSGGTWSVNAQLPVSLGGTGVASLSDILGTANQVSVAGGTARVIGGNVTLSLPQNIDTAATPTFAGLTTAGQTGHVVNPYGGGAGQAGEIRFVEVTGVGSNYVGFKAADDIAANVIWTLPAADGTNGYFLTTNGTGGLFWSNTLPGGSTVSFANITTGTNTAAAMTVDTGASLASSGTGYIQANRFVGSGSTTDAVDLGTAEIAGTLPVGRGGTGSTTYTSSQFLWYDGSNIVSSGLGSGNFLRRDAADTGSASVAAGWLYVLTNSSGTALGGIAVASSAGIGIQADGVDYGVLGRTSAATGSNYAVFGQNTCTGAGTTQVGTYGSAGSAGPTRNIGVFGSSLSAAENYAVWGRSSGTSADNRGVYGLADGGAGTKYAVYADATGAGTNYGLYATASGGATNWAGYFAGNVSTTGYLNLQSMAVPAAGNRLYAVGGDLFWDGTQLNGAGGGTVTSIDSGTPGANTDGSGLTFSADPITTTGSIALSNTAVTPGGYGSASSVATLTVDQQGRLTAAGSTSIAIGAGQITSGTLALARGGTAADLSGTGGAGQYVKQATLGGAFTVGTIPAGDIPSLDASKITTGTLGIARGGTNASSFGASSQFIWYDGASLVVSGYSNSSFAAASHAHSGADITSGTVADARLSSNVTLLNTAQTFTGQKTFSAGGSNDTLTFWPQAVGGTSYSGTLTNNDLTAARTWYLPDAGGTIALTSQLTSGTVTSVALSMPGQFTVSGSPVTTSGTLTASWNSQAANTVFAAPNGAAGVPTFRALVAADIPSGSGYYIQNQSAGDQSASFRISGTGRSGSANWYTIMGDNTTTQAWVTSAIRSSGFGYMLEPDAATDNRAAWYGYRNRSVQNDGTGYAESTTNAAIIGYNTWGDVYTYGIVGYCWNDFTRTGGILGSRMDGSYWASLGYKDQNSDAWGIYSPNNGKIGGSLWVGGGDNGTATGSGGGVLYLNPQDGANEGGEIELRGAAANPTWQIDLWSNLLRVRSSTTAGNIRIQTDYPSTHDKEFTPTNANWGYCGTSTLYWYEVNGGTKNAVKPDPENPDETLRISATESPKVTVEDHGDGQLADGYAEIVFADDFRPWVSQYALPNVQLTPLDDCRGLYIVERTPQGFSVRELAGGKSNARFSWRAAALRAGDELRPSILDRTHVLETIEGEKRTAAGGADDPTWQKNMIEALARAGLKAPIEGCAHTTKGKDLAQRVRAIPRAGKRDMRKMAELYPSHARRDDYDPTTSTESMRRMREAAAQEKAERMRAEEKATREKIEKSRGSGR
ncbi:MAG: hypothetical protein HYY17_10315 [Planctomycetes bacterium]|nr:hypothetical protein [Planctomycetota bacterium]